MVFHDCIGLMRTPKLNWMVFVAFLICNAVGFGWLHGLLKSEIQTFVVSQNYGAASLELQSIDRGFAFDVLFANEAPPTFAFEARLHPVPASGRRALWLYAAQATNHGQINIDHRGRTVGVVDNQLKTQVEAPIYTLSRVGELEVDGQTVALNVTGRNHTLARHYAELGLWVLAPADMAEASVLTGLRGQASAPAADLGTLFLLVGLAGLTLLMLNRDGEPGRGVRIMSTTVLLVLACSTVAYVWAGQAASRPWLGTDHGSSRVGIDHGVDAGFNQVVASVNQWQRQVLPNREVHDEVPASLQSSQGAFETELYRSEEKMPQTSVSEGIFGKAMAQLKKRPFQRLGVAFGVLAAVLLASIALDRRRPSPWYAGVALSASCVASVLLSLRLSQGWDEFFINLRHAYMLIHEGAYSINANQMIEASVDFIPLALTAALGALGVDLVNAFIAVSLLGNVGVVLFSYLIVKAVTRDRTWALVAAALMGLYPNVLWVGASGFSAVLFSAWILAASHFLLLTQRRHWGLALLATLTLVRTEGVLFAGLLMFYVHAFQPWPTLVRTHTWEPAVRRLFAEGILVLAPFIVSLVVRHIAFGHAIPNPVTFKNTGLDSAYLSAGLTRFTEIVTTHELHLTLMLIGLLAAALWVARRGKDMGPEPAQLRRLGALSLLTGVFVLPYFVGGGDWFPALWNRYGMPFNLVLTLLLLALLHRVFREGLKGWIGGAGLVVSCLVLALGSELSARFRPSNSFHRTWQEIHKVHAANWGRVDKLASLGHFLNATLPLDAVVSSPEEATIMYFAKREMMGLLGVSTPEIAAMPFQPMGTGDILHRRRGHTAVFHQRPDVIALFEPVIEGNFAAGPDLKVKTLQVLQADMFSQLTVDIAYYRVGSFRALEAMGYRHLTVSMPDRLFSVFVNETVFDATVKQLQASGFQRMGTGQVTYAVSPELSKKYVPAVAELMGYLKEQR